MPHCAAVRTCLQLLTHISGSVSLSLFPLPHPSPTVSRWARSQLGKHLTTGAHMNAQHSGSKRMPQWDTNAHTHTPTHTHTPRHTHTLRSVNLFLICCKLMELTSSGLRSPGTRETGTVATPTGITQLLWQKYMNIFSIKMCIQIY